MSLLLLVEWALSGGGPWHQRAVEVGAAELQRAEVAAGGGHGGGGPPALPRPAGEELQLHQGLPGGG